MMIRIFKRIGRSAAQGHREEGTALVELALSLPMLSIILLGAVEFARVAYASIEVTNAAHSAAVYAASSQAALKDTPGISNAASSDSPNLVGTDAVTVVSPVSTSCTCTNTSWAPSNCADNSTCQKHNSQMVTAVTVVTQTTFKPLVSLPGWKKSSFTLQGKSTEVVSNQ